MSGFTICYILKWNLCELFTRWKLEKLQYFYDGNLFFLHFGTQMIEICWPALACCISAIPYHPKHGDWREFVKMGKIVERVDISWVHENRKKCIPIHSHFSVTCEFVKIRNTVLEFMNSWIRESNPIGSGGFYTILYYSYAWFFSKISMFSMIIIFSITSQWRHGGFFWLFRSFSSCLMPTRILARDHYFCGSMLKIPKKPTSGNVKKDEIRAKG